jgi:hypothetical protein
VSNLVLGREASYFKVILKRNTQRKKERGFTLEWVVPIPALKYCL